MTADFPAYAPSDSLQGLLQRGRGLGHVRALQDPTAAAPFVYDCIRNEQRWDSQCDQRALYHARLVRDLELPLGPLLGQLAEDEEAMWRAASVLELLALAGSAEAREGLRSYVRDGEHWVHVVESIAGAWPTAWWEDLGDVARKRTVGEADRPWASEPWDLFGIDRDPQAVRAVRADTGRDRLDTDQLLALIAAPGTTKDDMVDALRALVPRGPQPGLIPLVPLLGTADGTRPLPPVRAAVRRLGVLAVPAARGWARDGREWLARLGEQVLAAHPGPEDLPALLGELAHQEESGEWCGPDDTARRLAHLGPLAAAAVPRLRRLVKRTPHTYERADYLEAIAAIDPGGAKDLYAECLRDCEARTRLLAIAAVRADAGVRQQVVALRDDPMEDPDVRAAAAERAEGFRLQPT
ncbi:hypothetical protein ACFY0G_25560 [Streptomyces sp. NPDC001552]|uniref:hypothetical protein n=1 Tax=Streptomyces sp. NPDC001552 TaxID=3364587 RepID=UPI0036AEDB61